jgi:hypothetical protein
MSKIQNFINAVSLGDKDEMAKAFSDVMRDKAQQAINVATIETAEKIYNAPATETETVVESEEIEEAEELLEMVEVPTDKKDLKIFLDKAKRMRATEKDYIASMKSLDLKAFGVFDKHARDHKDFKDAYQTGKNLPKKGGLEGNNPHKKNTYAYHLWMDIAGQGMADA